MVFNISTVVAAVLLSVIAVCNASIPSRGLITAAATRATLSDEDFLIDPSRNVVIRNENMKVELADLNTFPALAGVDVQSQISRVTLRPGQAFVPHFHPRGAEILNAIRGRFEVSFTTEGLQPKTIKNVVRQGHSTIFPQGLPHTTKCVSRSYCQFLSVFTSADPGLVPLV